MITLRARMWGSTLLAASLVAIPVDAAAQVVATSFDELRSLVRPGDAIDVTHTSGRRTKGRLGELSASSLELLVRRTGPDGREAFIPQARLSEDEVSQIRLERRDPLWKGTLIGLAPGAAVGVLFLFGAPCDCYTLEDRAPLALGTFLIAGGIGAVIGAGIDASIIERPTVYFQTPARRSSRVHASPVFSKSAAGVRMSVSF